MLTLSGELGELFSVYVHEPHFKDTTSKVAEFYLLKK